MKAEDLRIGNYVYRLDIGNVLCVDEISSSGDVRFKDIEDSIFQIEDIKPIPLNEEWLLKFGFVKDKLTNFDWYKDDFEIHLPNYFKWKDSNLNKIKHVHQIQNLYYALTNKELTIKELVK